jgi:hypothetical protein
MRTFPKRLKASLLSIGVGVAIFCLFAYSLMLFSVTQSIALKGESSTAPVTMPKP